MTPQSLSNESLVILQTACCNRPKPHLSDRSTRRADHTNTSKIFVHSRQATHQSRVWYVVLVVVHMVAKTANNKSRSYEASMTRSYKTNHVIAKNECTYKLPLHWRFGLSQIDPTTDRHKIAARLTLRHNFCFVEPRPAAASGYINTCNNARQPVASPTSHRLKYVPGAVSHVLLIVGRNGSLPSASQMA